MEEWIKKSDVLEMLNLPSDILADYIYELKGIWFDENHDGEWKESICEVTKLPCCYRQPVCGSREGGGKNI